MQPDQWGVCKVIEAQKDKATNQKIKASARALDHREEKKGDFASITQLVIRCSDFQYSNAQHESGGTQDSAKHIIQGIKMTNEG